jgi:hypothetical protein
VRPSTDPTALTFPAGRGTTLSVYDRIYDGLDARLERDVAQVWPKPVEHQLSATAASQ